MTARLPARPARLAPLALALLAATGAAAAQDAEPPQYHLEPIVIPGAASVFVQDMNDDGMAVGYFVMPDVGDLPFLWNGTEYVPLPLPPERTDGYAAGINNLGQITGYTATYTEDGATTTAVVWDLADLADITVITPDLPGNVNPAAINDLGTVVGFTSHDGQFNAFEWTPAGGYVDDGVPDHGPGTQAFWSRINNLGTKVGGWHYPQQTRHATIGQSGTPGIVAIAAGADDAASRALSINDSGVAVGEYDFGNDGSVAPVRFEDDTIFEIPGALLGLSTGYASEINEAGVIVGRAMDMGTLQFKAFVHIDGVSYDIAAQSDNGADYEYLLNGATVNADGVIAGTARGPDFSVVSFVARPIVDEEPPLEPLVFADGFEG